MLEQSHELLDGKLLSAILNLFLTCSSFLISFSLRVYKIFSYTTIKSLVLIQTAKKENKRKQLSIKVVWFLGEKYLACNLSLGLFSWWAVFDKSSERQFSLGATSSGILSGGNYLWGNFLGAIIIWEQLSGDNFPRGQLSAGNHPGG